MSTNQTTAPFAELAIDAGDSYDLSVWLTLALNHYPGGVVTEGSPFTQSHYVLEAGRHNGDWHLRTRPWSGSMTDEDVYAGPAFTDLERQTEGPDPLTLLRALLMGRTLRND